LLVVISGLPGTGKTTLGIRLSGELGLPFFYKDGFKERMFDALGNASVSRELSQFLGRFSIDCLEIIAWEMISKRKTVMIEANFDVRLFSPFLAKLKDEFEVQIAQILLEAEGQTLLDRFIEREHGSRHPGHGGIQDLERITPILLEGKIGPLAVESEVLTLNTTVFSEANYDLAQTFLSSFLIA
jgi:cytidylate kinase